MLVRLPTWRPRDRETSRKRAYFRGRCHSPCYFRGESMLVGRSYIDNCLQQQFSSQIAFGAALFKILQIYSLTSLVCLTSCQINIYSHKSILLLFP